MYLYLLGFVVLYYLYRWVRELSRVPDKGSKYVYITGCDTGFGNLLARHLDKKGFRVIASCFTEKGEEDLKKSCSSNLITTHLNVSSKESVAKAAAMIKDKVGERGECGVLTLFFEIGHFVQTFMTLAFHYCVEVQPPDSEVLLPFKVGIICFLSVGDKQHGWVHN